MYRPEIARSAAERIGMQELAESELKLVTMCTSEQKDALYDRRILQEPCTTVQHVSYTRVCNEASAWHTLASLW